MKHKYMNKKFDDSSWHSGGEFPDDLAPERGGTHIAMYFAWALIAGLASEEVQEEQVVKDFLNFRVTPIELIEGFDGKLIGSMFNKQCAEFTKFYYDSDVPGRPNYYNDLAEAISENVETVYHPEPDIRNLVLTCKIVQSRFDAWMTSSQ